jgi:hypothetical protein
MAAELVDGQINMTYYLYFVVYVSVSLILYWWIAASSRG